MGDSGRWLLLEFGNLHSLCKLLISRWQREKKVIHRWRVWKTEGLLTEAKYGRFGKHSLLKLESKADVASAKLFNHWNLIACLRSFELDLLAGTTGSRFLIWVS